MPDVILPALNEAAALPSLLRRLPEGYRAIVADNGSRDGTADVARAHGVVVVSEPRRGFGAACWAGLVASSPDDGVVCFMDADGSFDPADLPALAAPVLAGDLDLHLGARQAQRSAWPMHARLANRILSWELRRRLGLDLTDLGPMRAAGRTALLGLGIIDRRSGWPLEMVVRAGHQGWRIGEMPVAYHPRIGHSKVTGTVRGTITAARDMHRVLSDLAPVGPRAR